MILLAALARVLHFRVVHDGEVVFRQGDEIQEASERFLIIQGSVLVFSQRRSVGDGLQRNRGDDGFGECIETCNPGSSCGEVGMRR